jgi:hypothetical protein
MKRLNKEYPINVCDDVLVKYGTVNKDDPQVVYVNGRCWICPNEEVDYEDAVSEIEARMRGDIKDFIAHNDNFSDRFILDLDFSTDGLTQNMKRFLSFDFYLRQSKGQVKPIKDLCGPVSAIAGISSRNMAEGFRERGFSVSLRK